MIKQFLSLILVAMLSMGMIAVTGEESLTLSDACSNCPSITGDLALCWDGEQGTDTTAYVSGGTLAGTSGGATIDSNGAICGDEGLDPAQDTDIHWNHTDNTHLDAAEGYVCIDVRSSDWSGGTTGLWSNYVDANTRMKATITSAGYVQFSHKGDSSNGDNTTGTDAIPTDTDTTVCFGWSNTNDEISVKVGDNAWQDHTHSGTVTDYNTGAQDVFLGDALNEGNQADKIDNMKVYTAYKE
jgi:hypothetical protein